MTTHNINPDAALASRLRASGITPTQRRLHIGQFLFSKLRHLSADQVFDQVNRNSERVSQATVYNTLSLFVEKGLLHQIVVDPSKVFYDTNPSKHHHFYHVDTGILEDIPTNQIEINNLPELPSDTLFGGVNIIIQLRKA